MVDQLREKLKNSPFYKLETLILGLALLFGFVGAYLQIQRRNAFEQEIENKYKTTKILTLIKKLEKGSILKDSDINFTDILSDRLTKNMMTPKLLSQAIGQQLRIDALSGDPLLFSMIKQTRENQSFAHKIPIGERLFTLQVESIKGPAGEVNPGDHVDIIAEMTFSGKGTTLFTLLENVIVTAVGKDTDPSKKIEAKEVSFFVTPDEIERLHYAQANGIFFISLRNPFDKVKRKNIKGVDKNSFLLSSKVYEAADPSVKIEVNE